MNFPEQEYTYENWIAQFRTMEKLTDQLRFILTILYSLDAETQKQFHEQILKFEKIFESQNFMRKVKHRDALIENYATEYFGEDKGIDDPFRYKGDTEKLITKLSLEIMNCLGLIIKHLKSTEFTIGDGT